MQIPEREVIREKVESLLRSLFPQSAQIGAQVVYQISPQAWGQFLTEELLCNWPDLIHDAEGKDALRALGRLKRTKKPNGNQTEGMVWYRFFYGEVAVAVDMMGEEVADGAKQLIAALVAFLLWRLLHGQELVIETSIKTGEFTWTILCDDAVSFYNFLLLFGGVTPNGDPRSTDFFMEVKTQKFQYRIRAVSM